MQRDAHGHSRVRRAKCLLLRKITVEAVENVISRSSLTVDF